MTRLLTQEELADQLRVSPSWVVSHAAKGTIPSVKVGRYRRFDLDEVLAALKNRKEAA